MPPLIWRLLGAATGDSPVTQSPHSQGHSALDGPLWTGRGKATQEIMLLSRRADRLAVGCPHPIPMTKASTERFSDRVDNYVRYRPRYPLEVMELLRRECGLRPEHILADIASGTGIFTRLLLENGNRVFAVEPNTAMQAASSQLQESFKNLVPVAGTAEETTLPAASVDFITAAQAAHWFHPKLARAEFERILKPDGWCMFVWNERRTDGNPFLEQYERILLTYCADYKETRHGQTSRIIQEFFAGVQYQERIFQYAQDFDFEGLQGDCFRLLIVLCKRIRATRP